MKINKTFWQILLLIVSVSFFAACQSSATNNKSSAAAPKADTPTEAYKNLYAAVKSKNIPAIKQNMSSGTNEFIGAVSEMQKKPVEEVYSNGLTETTMSENLPPMRDERINENFGALEVQNPKGIWEDLPFVKEDGRWKLAVGDLFKGTYKSPGMPASANNSNTAMSEMVPAPNTDTRGGANMNPANAKPHKLTEKSAAEKR